MQATFGHLTLADPECSSPADRRYAIPAGVAEVMTDVNSLAYLGALPRMLGSIGLRLDNLLDAYRTGGGVSWAELGDDAREAQAAGNRPGSSCTTWPARSRCWPRSNRRYGPTAPW